MRTILLLIVVVVVLLFVFSPDLSGVTDLYDYQCGHSVGESEVLEARQTLFGGELGLCFQRDFVGIHTHRDKSQAWNNGHEQGIIDALSERR